MEFTLIYEGHLKSGNSARPHHKHRMRLRFHDQLKKLWTLPPLSYCDSYKQEKVDMYERFTNEPDCHF